MVRLAQVGLTKRSKDGAQEEIKDLEAQLALLSVRQIIQRWSALTI
jgi:hypothetical protein